LYLDKKIKIVRIKENKDKKRRIMCVREELKVQKMNLDKF